MPRLEMTSSIINRGESQTHNSEFEESMKKATTYVAAGRPDKTVEVLDALGDRLNEAEKADLLATAYRNKAGYIQSLADGWNNISSNDPLKKHIVGWGEKDAAEARIALDTANVYEVYATEWRKLHEQENGLVIPQQQTHKP